MRVKMIANITQCLSQVAISHQIIAQAPVLLEKSDFLKISQFVLQKKCILCDDFQFFFIPLQRIYKTIKSYIL